MRKGATRCHPKSYAPLGYVAYYCRLTPANWRSALRWVGLPCPLQIREKWLLRTARAAKGAAALRRTGCALLNQTRGCPATIAPFLFPMFLSGLLL